MAELTHTDVGCAFRELRLRRRLTVAAAASAAGLSAGHVSAIECGRARNPRFVTLVRLSGALDARLSEVIDLAAKRAETRQRG